MTPPLPLSSPVDDKGQREGSMIKSFYSWTSDNINMLFTILVVLASVDLSCSATKEVLQSQTPATYHHLDSSTGQLLTCHRCPPGHHMSAHCTATTQTVCTPCPSGHYTQYWNYLHKCLYCGTFCGEHQVVKEECSVLNDRVCECKGGYYWDADFCIRHSECPSGYGVKRRGTTETDTECEKCPPGSFSYSTSSRALCVNHTDCASLGRKTVLRGTCWHDNLCALSCEELKDGGEFKLLRTFLPDFFTHHKMRVVKLRKLVWRLMATEEEQEHQEQQQHPASSLSQSGQRGLLQGQVKDWIRDASEEDLRRLPEILRKTHQSVMAERLEGKMRELQEASECNSVRNGVTSSPHCDVEEVSQSE
ncbi:tumor necrosis factor receptor superfamily member 6B-like isoform X2 [Oncorhynchus tshawytscha]|uniref:tumor necrosis factor receptor superfamily member 6B-like isoform X2 n=1 Tax=Oncorhynchus tshawytscha TaxID=74940 RepID=UPI000D09D98E|nr:tumor necrosis factor receptor superfamily member 6B-like isoform X2 [Oncorhynchus tshawytscha]